MKACIKCAIEKPLTDYYRHSAMADGHLNACKDCVKEGVRANRAANAEYYQAYDRARAWLPDRVLARKDRQERVKTTPDIRSHETETKRKWARQHVIKRQCHTIVGNAIRDGRLVPQPCERCGHAINVHAHHEDYSKPLDVIWLCPPCHGVRHREINEERRQKVA